MKIFLTLTAELEPDFWDADLSTRSDSEIIALVKEDLSAFTESAAFEVSRTMEPDAALTRPLTDQEELDRMIY